MGNGVAIVGLVRSHVKRGVRFRIVASFSLVSAFCFVVAYDGFGLTDAIAKRFSVKASQKPVALAGAPARTVAAVSPGRSLTYEEFANEKALPAAPPQRRRWENDPIVTPVAPSAAQKNFLTYEEAKALPAAPPQEISAEDFEGAKGADTPQHGGWPDW